MTPGTGFEFSRKHRLLDGQAFQKVFDGAQWRAGDDLFLILARQNNLAIHRLGMVVGRKRVRLAVDRALIKRQIRESFRHRPEQLAGLDIIVLVRSNLRHPDRRQLAARLNLLWDKLLAKRGQA